MSNISDINYHSDKAILKNIGLFIQQTRLKQNITQEELAAAATISRSTLSLIERGDNISLNNLIKILRILNSLPALRGFEVTDDISPLQLAKGVKKKRKRASKQNLSQNDTEDLGW